MAKEIMNEELKPKKSFNTRKLKYGIVSTIIVIVFIAVVVVLNVVADTLTERKDLKLDLTKQKYYEVSQETLDYLAQIDTEVEIAVMADESDFLTTGTYYKMVYETLKKYENASDKITLNFYNLVTNPDVASRFSEYYQGEIVSGNIVITANERAEVISVTDLFTISSDYYTGSSTIENYKGEQELTSAVMTVTDANPQTVAVLLSYNGSSIFSQNDYNGVMKICDLLDKNGYKVEPVDLMTGDLSPENYDMLVVPAPYNDLSESDVDKIEAFLSNDGKLDKNMIYIASPYQYATPNIDAFLSDWGIEVGQSIVQDDSDEYTQKISVGNGVISAPILKIAEEEYSAGLSNTKLPIVAMNSRPINIEWEANNERTVTALLTTSDTGYQYPMEFKTFEESQAEEQAYYEELMKEMLEQSEAENGSETEEATEEVTEEATEEVTEEVTEFNLETAEKSAQAVVAVATKTFFDSDNKALVGKIMAIGGTYMLDPYFTESTAYNNADYIINAINKMCGKESRMIIAEKDLTKQPISITADQKSTITNVIYLIPIAVVVAGVVVYLRRRNR